MRTTLEVHVCDVTGEIFKHSDALAFFEVYSVGRNYDGEKCETTNQTITSLSMDKSLLSDDFGLEKVIYVDDDNNIVLFGDEDSIWKPEPNNKELISKINNAIDKIVSDEYNADDEITSVEINNKKII